MPSRWTPPDSWTRITTLDVHTAGEPLRIITGGFPSIPGDSILAKRRYARENLDHLRTTLMWEPRGHADMYGAILTDPVTPDGDAGVLFLHNEGYSTMCGHGIIGLAMAGVEAGLFPLPPGSGGRGEDPEDLVLRLDTPAGRVTASTHFAVDDGRVLDGHRDVSCLRPLLCERTDHEFSRYPQHQIDATTPAPVVVSWTDFAAVGTRSAGTSK